MNHNLNSHHEVLIPTPQHTHTMSQQADTALINSIEHFKTIPWCAPIVSEKGWTAIPTRSREPKTSTEDSFFAQTLATPTTMSHHLTLVNAPTIPLPASHRTGGPVVIPRVRNLWQLEHEVNGFPGIAHGGLLGSLCDEGMGILLTANSEYGSDKGVEITAMTVYLNVRYRAAVATPGVVLVESWVEKSEGRKTVLRTSIKDGKGVECVTAEGLFVTVPNSRL
jgi:thioesterase superfamily protein 4